MRDLYRAVVLGDPGSGKSTLAEFLCHRLATRYQEKFVLGREMTPILVVLREYGAFKISQPCSILKFIEITAESKYNVKPPQGSLEYLLLNGRVLLIFDGLDELTDTSYRQEIRDDIESFCNLYPSTPVLVTSRKIGYGQTPLDQERFELYRLAPFDEMRIGQYVVNWFEADSERSTDEHKEKASCFLDESKIAGDLRANPLMLALMCNLYLSTEGGIYSQKPS
ncbi:MAG: NACHT domain-containing protein [Armatimonadetes bacterium]|nr:NACHT domain-containing protein [Armatimonadota bacterium]